MRFSGTDLMAVGVIAVCGAAGLAFTEAVTEDGHTTSTYTVTTDYDEAEDVFVGERVERIRTDANGVHVERHRRVEGEAGATVIRIRGDAGAVEPDVDVRVRVTERVRLGTDDEAAQPLIYIDGVRFEGDFDSLDPDDIERIEVVKGAAALELFGEAATGGVIQIFMNNVPARNPGR